MKFLGEKGKKIGSLLGRVSFPEGELKGFPYSLFSAIFLLNFCESLWEVLGSSCFEEFIEGFSSYGGGFFFFRS